MSALDRILPTPRMVELECVDLAVPPSSAWEIVRHGELARSKLVHALFATRTLPDRVAGHGREPLVLRLDDMASTPDRPGFRILADDPPREVVVGAIGKVWHPRIPFVHVPTAEAFAAFDEPGFVKVAWALQLSPRGDSGTRVVLELRVDATDEPAWRKFRAYFRLIGPGSRFIRRSLLAALAREYGTPESKANERPLPGDDLLPDADAQITHAITVRTKPEAIWPWLVQMGCRRAGFYSIDALDNAGVPSAREIHPELQHIRVGDVIPATPRGEEGFEVLRVEPNRALVLGGLYDTEAKKQLRFGAERPAKFWKMTWAFALEPLDARSTRLYARARVEFPEQTKLRAIAGSVIHRIMQTAQLEHIAARAERRLEADRGADIGRGLGGAAIMAAAFLTPFLRSARNHWGLAPDVAGRTYPGDDLVREPRWGFTHGIEIDAPVEQVWPWVAQIGADRAGFYSYQWLENMVGCNLRNAETIHPDWAVREGGSLLLHPKMAPLRVVSVSPGRYFVAYAQADAKARAAGRPWAEASWLFWVEPLGPRRSRFISRCRCASSDDLATRARLGPALTEPIGFAMDRRMLMEVKARAERRHRAGGAGAGPSAEARTPGP